MIALFLDPGIVLVLVASKQHIAVRRADDDAHFVCKATIFGVCIERIDVHGGPDIIALEPKDEFEDMAVGPGTDRAVVGVQLCPGVELLLVVEKDAAVLHARPVGLQKALRKEERFAFFDGDIRKEIPRRYAEKAGKFVNSKNRSPSSLPCQDDAPIAQKFDKIALPTKFPSLIKKSFDGISCERVNFGVFAKDADEEDRAIRLIREMSAAATNFVEIAAEILGGDADGGRRCLLQIDADLLPLFASRTRSCIRICPLVLSPLLYLG